MGGESTIVQLKREVKDNSVAMFEREYKDQIYLLTESKRNLLLLAEEKKLQLETDLESLTKFIETLKKI